MHTIPRLIISILPMTNYPQSFYCNIGGGGRGGYEYMIVQGLAYYGWALTFTHSVLIAAEHHRPFIPSTLVTEPAGSEK